jgi:Cu/Ag efflux protein CusF
LLLIPCLSSVFRRRGEAIRPSPDPEEPMKRFFALLPLVLAASLVSAQETNPSRDPNTKGNERQFAGEVVATDTTAKTLTVKTSVPDAKGDRSEKTMTLAVAEDVAAKLATLNAGDKVTVLWRRDEAQQRDVVVKLNKGETTTPPNQ